MGESGYQVICCFALGAPLKVYNESRVIVLKFLVIDA